MPRLEPPPGFLRSEQAQERLGMSDTLLRKYVKEGQIKKYGPPGSKQKPFYSEKEVEALRLALRSFPEAQVTSWRDNPSFRFEVATENDISAIRAINYLAYRERYPDDFPISYATCLVWMKKNPRTFFVSRDQDGNVRGSAILLPVSNNLIEQFIHDEVEPDDIPEKEIEEYLPGASIDNLYVLSLVADPSFSERIKKVCGRNLIQGIAEFFIGLGDEGVEIETVTARSFLPDGIRLLQRIGFANIHSPIPGKRLYVANVAESGIEFLEKYRESLARWKSKQSKSQVEQ